MSLNAIISNTLTGLFTNQAALRVTSNNVANVNTPGYSRLVVQQVALVVGNQGAGVSISGIDRIVDRFLEAATFSAASSVMQYSVAREFHDRFQAVLGRPDGDSNISARVNTMFSRLAELTLDPTDKVARQATLAKIQDLADEISRVERNIQDLRTDVSLQIDEQLERANELIQRVQSINPAIIRETLSGGETGALESQRASALRDLSQIIDIRLLPQENGALFVTTAGGISLVGNTITQFEYQSPGTVTAQTNFSQIQMFDVNATTGSRILLNQTLDPEIRGGRIKGLLELRDDQLRNLSLSLGEFSANLMHEVNAVHNAATAVPAPNSLTGRTTAVDGTHAPQFTGIVTFSVVDNLNQVVATHTVDFDAAPPADFSTLVANVNAGLGGAGTLSLTNGVMSFSATVATDGIVMAQDPTTPSQRGGQGFSHYFGMNDLMEAAETGFYQTGFTAADDHNLVAGGQTVFAIRDADGTTLAQYTMSVPGTTFGDIVTDLNASVLGSFMTFGLDADGVLTRTEVTGFEDLRLNILSDSTDFGGNTVTFGKLFGIGDFSLAHAARRVNVLSRVLNNPSNFALAEYDVLALVGDVAISAGDQQGILNFSALETLRINYRSAGELANQSVSLSQYGAAFLGNAGIMADRVTSLEADNLALKEEIDARNSDISGVNIDEEIANMIIYQNSFAAAARLITVADEMFQTLLDAI